MPLFVLLLLLRCSLCLCNEHSSFYSAVVDAGSTGSRIFVFHFYEENDEVKVVATPGAKVTPGLSSFANNLDGIVEYMMPLFESAAEKIPAMSIAGTKLFVKGTAGMRLLSTEDQEAIWNRLVVDVNAHPSMPFHLPRDHVGTINGTFEAYYAVLAANFIGGKLDTSLIHNGEELVGALDMGGSSTQLVFHTGTEIGKVIRPEHFWSHSWLSYGAQKIREAVTNRIIQTAVLGQEIQPTMTISNPCGFHGHTDTITYQDYSVQLVGTGQSQQCVQLLRQVLWPEGCHNTPCPIENIQHPPVGGLYYGMSVYFFALDCVKHLGTTLLPHWPQSSVDELEAASHDFCQLDWNALLSAHSQNAHPYTQVDDLPYRCIDALYITTLLEDGFGFDGSHRGITLALEVEGTEVEWTLGLALAEECEHSRLLEHKQHMVGSESAQTCEESIESKVMLSSGKSNDLPRIAASSVLARFSRLYKAALWAVSRKLKTIM